MNVVTCYLTGYSGWNFLHVEVASDPGSCSVADVHARLMLDVRHLKLC